MRGFVVKLSTVFVLLLAIVTGSALFWVSQKVQQLEREQRTMQQKVASEEEGIRVLAAEWDYLNRPDRLEALAARYLKAMEPVAPEDLLKNANAVPEKGDEEEGMTQIVPARYKEENEKGGEKR